MVRKMILIVLLCGLLALCGCRQAELQMTEEIATYLQYDTMDAFTAALMDQRNEDKRLNMDYYIRPTGIPDGYALEAIFVNTGSMKFRYYPKENVGSGSPRDLGDALEFILYRWDDMEDPLSGLMEQSGKTEADLVDGKYLVDRIEIGEDVYWEVYWRQDGTAVGIWFPRGFELQMDDLKMICTAEKIRVS